MLLGFLGPTYCAASARNVAVGGNNEVVVGQRHNGVLHVVEQTVAKNITLQPRATLTGTLYLLPHLDPLNFSGTLCLHLRFDVGLGPATSAPRHRQWLAWLNEVRRPESAN